MLGEVEVVGEVGKECSGTKVGCKSSSPPFSLERYGISVQLFAFCMICKKPKKKKTREDSV